MKRIIIEADQYDGMQDLIMSALQNGMEIVLRPPQLEKVVPKAALVVPKMLPAETKRRGPGMGLIDEEHLKKHMAKTGFNANVYAKTLGVEKGSVYRAMKKLGWKSNYKTGKNGKKVKQKQRAQRRPVDLEALKVAMEAAGPEFHARTYAKSIGRDVSAIQRAADRLRARKMLT